MTRTLRALAALLSYPDEALRAALPEVRDCAPREALPLADEIAQSGLYEAQERYVALFDRSRALSLHLFEHVHGESRDRGQAMVDLLAMYEAHGLTVQAHELPDYIPAFLEFLSVLESKEARKLIGETAHILRALGDRLAERGSPYAAVFAAVLALARLPGLSKPIGKRVTAEPDRSALDAQWMDPEVTFGPGPQIAPVRFYRNGVAA
jgi:nitrate reductase molybdenum cofactor assembly chaperone NarJ/NarW